MRVRCVFTRMVKYTGIAVAMAIPVHIHAQGVDSVTTTDSAPATVTPAPKTDSIYPRADSIQARIGRDRAPRSLEIGDAFTYTREQFFASGAVTVNELLMQIPGLTTFQSGWLHTPQVAGYNGDLGRIRIFFDGIELDELNSRQGGIVDLSALPVWALQEMTVTRGASEVRIDLRSWEYNNVSPYTRFDLYTGDLNTTVYRAFYGKRYYNGAGLQIAGERYNASDARIRSGGDKTTLLFRYGIARARWSADANMLRANSTRTVTQRLSGGQALPSYRGVNQVLYLRGAVGREGDGPFVQVVAAFRNFKENSPHADSARSDQFGFPVDTADTLTKMNQYVATVGFDKWGGRIRVTDRFRTIGGQSFNAVAGSFDYTHRIFALSTLAETDAYSGFTRLEALARVQPLPFLAFTGAVGHRRANEDRTLQPGSRSARAEVGVKLWDGPWLIGGIVTRDTAVLLPPAVFDSAFVPVATGSTTGTTLALRGPLAYGFDINVAATRWPEFTPYVPQYQATSELRFFTEWRRKFPRGDFSFLFAPRMDYRSRVYFPQTGDTRRAGSSGIYSLRIELRIMQGTLTYQYRNLRGTPFEQVPGYLMPRVVNYYGVRWHFFQ